MSAAGRPIVLINAGAYIPAEMSAEFGPLPPAFLPVGMRRLYELQVEALRPLGGDVHLTLPDSFDLPAWDAARLAALGVTVIRSPDGLELGAALLFALGRIGFEDRPLRILHGDTLVAGVDPAAEDVLGVADGADGYRWSTVVQVDGRVQRVSPPELVTDAADRLRLTGYFAFANAARFAEGLALSRGDLYGALDGYAEACGLRVARTGRWLDFGHVQTFFRSRREITTQRAFNALEIDEVAVRKRSVHESAKLRAEAAWLRAIPPRLRPYGARLLDEGEDERGYFYATEYAYMPTLAELFVFGRLQPASWKRILASCQGFLDAAAEGAPAAGPTLDSLVVDKTRDRLERHAAATGLDLDAPNRLNGRSAPSLLAILDDVAARIRADAARPAVMHGDFCFSNVLFDFRTDRIRVIDPRGADLEGRPTIFGDTRYDAAKLMHSVVGRYDLIIAGQVEAAEVAPNAFTLAFPEDEGRAFVERHARTLAMGGVRLDSDAVAAATISLFLSMPPLHADRPDRQTAFIANAIRLHLALQDARP